MDYRYVQLTEREQPALPATLFSAGLERRSFERATGWDYGAREHRYEAGRHCISGNDRDRLREVVARRAESEPDFWSDYIDRGVARGQALVDSARSLAKLAGDVRGPREMMQGFTAFADATKAMTPFLAATPEVRAALESVLIRRITEELGSGNSHDEASALVSRLAAPPAEPEAIREIRDCYGIAAAIMDDDGALDLFRTTSVAVAAAAMKDDFPGLYDLIRGHVDDYGWLRRNGSGCEPGSTKALLERIQVVLLRWKPETVVRAAQRTPRETVDRLLGFSPSEPLGRLAGALRDLLTLRPFRWDVHRQADCIATPFFARMAEAMGCTHEQVLFSSEEEVLAALSEQAALPIAEIDRRIRNSFTVERAGDGVQVRSNENPPADRGRADPPAAPLTGMSVCRGRAIGPVRVIHAAAEIRKLEVGDILVTATSSPDVMGGESVFPTRAGPPLGLENAAAIVTDEGGFLSHAAIVSREHQIPCVVGTERATTALFDGQVVEVDATQPAGRVLPLESS
jgi:phosphohistidine swiveling domain-containing protein